MLGVKKHPGLPAYRTQGLLLLLRRSRTPVEKGRAGPSISVAILLHLEVPRSPSEEGVGNPLGGGSPPPTSEESEVPTSGYTEWRVSLHSGAKRPLQLLRERSDRLPERSEVERSDRTKLYRCDDLVGERSEQPVRRAGGLRPRPPAGKWPPFSTRSRPRLLDDTRRIAKRFAENYGAIEVEIWSQKALFFTLFENHRGYPLICKKWQFL